MRSILRKKSLKKYSLSGKKIGFFVFLYAKNDGRLKKDSQPQGFVLLCSDIFLNVPRSRINKVRKTEFLFRPPFDLFLIAKIELDFSSMFF